MKGEENNLTCTDKGKSMGLYSDIQKLVLFWLRQYLNSCINPPKECILHKQSIVFGVSHIL